MNDEIKEILDNFEKYEARYKLHNETQFIITHREIQVLLEIIKDYEKKDQQIDQLTNNWDELEEWLKEYIKKNDNWYNNELSTHDKQYYGDSYYTTNYMLEKFLNKMKEIKEKTMSREEFINYVVSSGYEYLENANKIVINTNDLEFNFNKELLSLIVSDGENTTLEFTKDEIIILDYLANLTKESNDER